MDHASQTAWDDSHFQTYPQGNLLYDANPQRVTDLIIPSTLRWMMPSGSG
ncbi:MAG: hypothetical protein M5U34_09660 [Chloroflexi bacterium]|nr:hypothetical protein [Chloroflexota bacterium]